MPVRDEDTEETKSMNDSEGMALLHNTIPAGQEDSKHSHSMNDSDGATLLQTTIPDSLQVSPDGSNDTKEQDGFSTPSIECLESPIDFCPDGHEDVCEELYQCEVHATPFPVTCSFGSRPVPKIAKAAKIQELKDDVKDLMVRLNVAEDKVNKQRQKGNTASTIQDDRVDCEFHKA